MKIEVRNLGITLIAMACAPLLLSFVAICVHTGTAWPWNVVVHEDGKRTLLQTLLFYDHAVGELPLDALLGIAIGACAFVAIPASRRSGQSRRALMIPGCLVVAAIGAMLVGTLWSGGPALLTESLMQNHTRSGAPPVLGSHWRYHLLERLSDVLVSIGVAGLLHSLTRPEARLGRPGVALATWMVVVFLAVTVALTPDVSSWRLPFVDPQYIGHQAREILTHFLVTVPLAWGACLVGMTGAAPLSLALRRQRVSKGVVAAIAAGVAGVMMILYLAFAAVTMQVASYGQTADFTALVAAHFFEHGFTYVVVPTLAVLVHAALARATLRSVAERRSDKGVSDATPS